MGRGSNILLILFALVLVSGKNSISSQLKDFEVFKNVITQKEGRLDLHTSIDSIQFHLEALKDNLSKDKSDLEQYKAYSFTLSKIQCGHTQIHPTKAVMRDWLSARNSLPLDYLIQGKKLYSNKLLPQDNQFIHDGKSKSERAKKIKSFSEIVSIDGKSLHEMMLEISPYISSDEDGIDFKYFQVAQLFEFYRHMSQPFQKDSIYVRYIESKDTLGIYFKTGTSPVNTMNLRLKQMSDAFAIKEKNIGSFEIVRSNVGYFRFESFKKSYGPGYELFLDASFKKIRDKKIEKLIIDLRGNTGGAMQYSFMRYFVGEDTVLGRYVVEKPKKGFEDRHIRKWNFDYYKHIRMSRVQKRKSRRGVFDAGEIRTKSVKDDLRFDGDIVVVTDEGTFSAASILACHLKTLCNAQIIGRTAGGSFYQGNAGSLIAQLPNSGFKLFVNPNTFYSHLTDIADPIAIKQPDIDLNPGYLKPRKMDDYYLKAAIHAFD